MAATRNRRTARVTKRGTNAGGIQRQINQDYANIIRDYRKLGVELFRKPVTRYILGGVALTALVPFVMNMFRNEEVQTFVRDNVEGIRTRIDGMIHTADSGLDTLNQ
jgi:hypothetical protein